MTKFVKSEFSGQEYVTYGGKFVARFKHNKSGKATFLTFLVKNFTVEEYFLKIENGEAPLSILSAKGYIHPNVKRMLKNAGYEVSTEGYKRLVRDMTSGVR